MNTKIYFTAVTLTAILQCVLSLDYMGNVEGKLYFIEPYFGGTGNHTSWIDAWKVCHDNGMSLASITSKAQIDLVAQYLLNDVAYLWVAGSNFGTAGSFHWMTTDSNDDVDPTLWGGVGSPDGPSPRCLQVYTSTGWLEIFWYSTSCETATGFICHKI